MAQFQLITGVGYSLEVGFEFDDILAHSPSFKRHPILQHIPPNTREILYGIRTESMCLHYAVREGETIQNNDVMSWYPYKCTCFEFPLGHTRM